jgi:hypothetical protein
MSMGTHRESESGKNHHNAFQKMECPCIQTLCFHNALHHFMLWAPPVLSMSLRIIKLSVEVQLFCFGNPTDKIVTGTPNTWELLIANHLDQTL